MVSNHFTDVNVVENVTVFYVLYTPEQNNTNVKKRKAALVLSFLFTGQPLLVPDALFSHFNSCLTRKIRKVYT